MNLKKGAFERLEMVVSPYNRQVNLNASRSSKPFKEEYVSKGTKTYMDAKLNLKLS